MAVQQPTSDPQKPAFAAIPSPLLELLPDAGAFASNVRRSKFIGVFWALLLSLVCGGLFVLLDLDSAALPMVFIAIFVVPFLLWRYRKLSLYIIFPAAILFEVLPSDISASCFAKFDIAKRSLCPGPICVNGLAVTISKSAVWLH